MIVTVPQTAEDVWLGLVQRRAASMTQAEMARRLGISRAGVCRMEARSLPPKLTTITGYAAILGVRLRITYEPNRQEVHQ